MRTVVIKVKAEDGEERSAGLLICDDCESQHWIVFQLDGQRTRRIDATGQSRIERRVENIRLPHIHLQCAVCGTSFCPGGTCGKEGT